jgi:hypothetical protein
VRPRFWLEAAAAVANSALLLVTLARHEWIELLFGVDPDHHAGWLEWIIVVVAFAATATFSIIAHGEWRRRLVAPPRSEILA